MADEREVKTYMDDTYSDNKNDEIINVKLPRSQYDILREVIRREEAYNYWTARIKSSWVFVVGGGILTIFLLWDKIHDYVALKV